MNTEVMSFPEMEGEEDSVPPPSPASSLSPGGCTRRETRMSMEAALTHLGGREGGSSGVPSTTGIQREERRGCVEVKLCTPLRHSEKTQVKD